MNILTRSSLLLGAAVALVAAALPQSARAQAVTVSTMVNFDGTNGDTPYTALTLGSDGNFYGTTSALSADRSTEGTIFQLTPAGALSTQYTFAYQNDANPVGSRPNGLVQGSDGSIYGTNFQGGNGRGTVFRFAPGGALGAIHTFTGGYGLGTNPEAALIQGRDGIFYGTTSQGFDNSGSVYAISPSGAYTQLAVFKDPNVGNPRSALLQASDGNFYGAARGGSNNSGVIYKMTPSGNVTVLAVFTGPNGATPTAELIQGTDGNLYGTTSGGGSRPNANYAGTVFRLTLAGELTTLVNFDGSNGNSPRGALVQGRDGNFYGTTYNGYANLGTIFKMTPAGVLTQLYEFPSDGTKGAYPYAALIQGPNGDFYGTTSLSGPGGHGTVFRMNISPNGVQEATLGNIATRLPVGTNDNALIGGFIVTGTNPKSVIIRGIGPSLGVAGALADPTLELRDSTGQLVAFNDDWKDTQQPAIEKTGIPPSNQFESAIVASLTANNSSYTAILRGKNGTTGRGVVEVYDLDQSVDSRLANISTRGLVGTGDNALIGGFISGPNTKVVVRAIGPSLAQSGVNSPLLDPTLELRDSNGVVVRANNDWKDTQQAELQASGIAPKNDRESALVVTLTAGSYTAVVRGLGDTTGIGVVEVYNLR